ncbi:MAG: hypothetical protein Q7U86_00315 [Draconibacterium sp.]|nr:hypothetical protein [Draconibacterium sp.]
MTTIMTTTTTMRTTTTFLLRFTALAVFCFTILATTFQVQKLNAQNVDQLTKKQGTDFPANFLSVVHSDPLTIEVGFQDYMFEINQASGVPLGYVEVNTVDSWARDYSALAGSSEFTVNFDPNVVDFGKTVPSSNPARISILELKNSPGGNFQVALDRGKTTLCFPLGNETGEEELGNRVQLLRTKDGRLAAVVNFTDSEGVLAGQYPGISENICMVLPLQETTPAKSLKFAKDSDGNIFALLQLRDGKTRVKAGGDGKGNLGVTLLTPSDKEMAEKMEMTLVVVK